jgi:DNA-binding transcriptional regulator YhcF (GntR family)
MLDLEEQRPGAPAAVQLADALRRELRTGRYRPGSLLPSSRELAQDLDHTHNTVAAAYRLLGDEGFIELRFRARPRVRSIDEIANAHTRRLDGLVDRFRRILRDEGYLTDEINAGLRRSIAHE